MEPGWWTRPVDDLVAVLQSDRRGLTSAEAARRQAEIGANAIADRPSLSRLRVLVRQIRSPLLWLLVFAAAISATTSEWVDASIVMVIVTVTVAFGYFREYAAERAVAMLAARVRTTSTVLRDGEPAQIARESIVPGDVILLSAGSLVPADAVVIDANDCFVSESLLTGESYPVEKHPGIAAASAAMAERSNCVFLGTNVRSGTARVLAIATGRDTAFAEIARHLLKKPPETDFDRGIRRFGYFLTSAMLLLTLLVFVAHVLRGRPAIETLLFSVALAVGLSPELLPAILSINLARGARVMAGRGVLVRRLNAIENLGSMNVLCTDKTGTLTDGTVGVEGAWDPAGARSEGVLEMAALNAQLQTGLANPLDAAILQAHVPAARAQKLGEIPFDFIRKRLSVIVKHADAIELITKGAFASVIDVCTQLSDGRPLDDVMLASLHARHEEWSRQGIRVIAVATRAIDEKPGYTRDDETNLRFVGCVTFVDRVKDDAARAIADLERLGVEVKIITGDNELVARHVASQVALRIDGVLSGREIAELDGAALAHAVAKADLFVAVDPMQKERIILALKHAGRVVGFLGDGVNDAPAMHAADTSVSVDGAVDVAREAADFVLIDHDLDVLRGGIEEGRRTFANTLKYILTTMSANLGNMISMAVASLVLPFLPLLAGQILLNNLLSDVPAVGIAEDSVDPELVARPPRWDIRFIGRFMTVFGLISSLFDFVTFGVLLWLFHASVELFRTGWFVESLLTELVIALVVRTRRPFFRSRPGIVLLASTIAMVGLALTITWVPITRDLGFTPLPLSLLGAVVGITAAYVAATELGKRHFYTQVSPRVPRLAVTTGASGD